MSEESVDMNKWGLHDLVKHTYKMLEKIDSELTSFKNIVTNNDKETAQKINDLEKELEMFRLEYETKTKTIEEEQRKRHANTRIVFVIIGSILTIINMWMRFS